MLAMCKGRCFQFASKIQTPVKLVSCILHMGVRRKKCSRCGTRTQSDWSLTKTFKFATGVKWFAFCRTTKRQKAVEAYPKVGNRMHEVVGVGSVGPTLLSLHSLLFQEQVDNRSVEVRIPDHWEQKLHQMWVKPLAPLPDGMRVHPQTLKAFDKLAVSRQSWSRAQCVIYIDGSVSSKGKAWSMVVIIQGGAAGESLETFEGVCAAPVTTDSSQEHWLGAVYDDNVAAELCASFVALSYALSLFSGC